jgi:two-component system LytT family response regulator
MTPRLTTVIVDDEAPARRLLRRTIEKDHRLTVVGEADDVGPAIELIEHERPDVVFLDISMPGGDGFDVLDAIQAPHMASVVFVTAYDAYALRAFDAAAQDYLVKPFDESRLGQTLDRLCNRLADAGGMADASAVARRVLREIGFSARPQFIDRIPVAIAHGRMTLQPVNEIDWIEADAKHVHLHTAGGRKTVRQSIGALERKLDPSRFVRVSRSAIVNVRSIREIQSWFDGDYMFLLSSGTKVTTTKTYRDAVRRLIGKEGR